MSDLNSVSLSGHVAHAPELKYTPNGKPVARFELGVVREIGEGKVFTDYLSIVVWGKAAEFVAEHVKENSFVGVQGQIQTRSWEAEGAKHKIVEIAASFGGVRLLGA